MVNLFRKYQQPLMVLVTIFIIITFVWFWNGSRSTNLEHAGNDTIATIYGRHISEAIAQREGRKFYVALELGLIDLIQDLAGYDRAQAVDNFVWNLQVLRHEASELQIAPTDDEVKTALTELRPLQTDGQFDANKLNELVQRSLTPRGFTDTVIDDLIRDDLRLKKLKALIGSSIELSPAELRVAYDQEHQNMVVSLLRFSTAAVAATLQISDDDVKKAFETRRSQFQSDEKRKVKFVSFELTAEQKKLTGKERNAELEKLANRANEFTQAMLDKDAKLDAVAVHFSTPVVTTGDFTQSAPDPQLAQIPALAAAAFALSPSDPNSDVVQGENGFYVLHLEEVIAARPLTLDEAKPKVIEALKAERAKEAVALQAGAVRKQIEDAMKAGKSFAEAAAAAGQKVETLPPFSLAEPAPTEGADQQQIMEKAVELGEKQLSEFVPNEAGGLLVYLDRRQPVDEAQFAKEKTTLEPLFRKQKEALAFREWLRLRREAAKLQLAQRS